MSPACAPLWGLGLGCSASWTGTLTGDQRDTLAEASFVATLHPCGALAVIHTVVRHREEAGSIIRWAAPEFLCKRTTQILQLEAIPSHVISTDMGITRPEFFTPYFLPVLWQVFLLLLLFFGGGVGLLLLVFI